MSVTSPNGLLQLVTSMPQRLYRRFRPGCDCECSEGTCTAPDCECACSDYCPAQEWTTEDLTPELPDQPTLNMLTAGEKVKIGQLYLPLQLKKRLLCLGLTNGTEIAVISNDRQRMIVSVRDSRLGLSRDLSTRITYQ
jgi:Fe2+ transport system protein FeoA